MMYYPITLISLVCLCQTIDPFDILADAQAANLGRVRSGTTSFRSTQTNNQSQKTIIEGTFSWDDDNGFWIYQMSDPFNRQDRDHSYSPIVGENPKVYKLIVGNKSYVTNPFTNRLVISSVPNRSKRGTTLYHFLDLFPDYLWTRNSPEQHINGKTWISLTRKTSPSTRVDSQLETFRPDDETYRCVRTDPGQGVLTMDFSLKYAGNLVSARYDRSAPPPSISQSTYRWNNLPDGTTVLDSCESTEIEPGSNRVVSSFKVELWNLKIVKSSGDRFNPTQFYKLLPKNTIVVDRIRDETFPLNGKAPDVTDHLKSLVGEVHSRGFAKK